jgi:hypothetical protein
MKVSNRHTATAFEQPSVRGWVVVFVCGFLTACILGLVLCLILWLVGLGAAAMKLPLHPAFTDTSPLTAWRVILQIAGGFGILLATLSLFESANRRRQEVRVPGHNPIIGDFEMLPHFKTWHAKPVLPTGQVVSLNGSGEGPSAAQASLWQQFIAQYDALCAAASGVLLTPPHPLEECRSVVLTPKGITLSRDGRLNVAFQFTTVPDNVWTSEVEEPFPIAIFSPTLELEKAEWVTTQG